ncbi:hypothetical protein J2W32_005850 [Variovorax boronicumulans]|uniref:DUF2169 domain-containing protein n=1 Tax=Variovorax boronicumulans TaxID=436515 RepID=A0AAW8D2F4_9BURK|nr:MULTISPECIES: DUF2169 domain-containing protein [Variovorax]MDP9896740.1 hypothetical protein [Variovorax boronicumulans]MDQ0034149.1 hypothetical protein [Variovorax boronicumulans]MDQ0056781.1 hypothetical protein [Variovorax boronicumulans]MDQ0612152.1 hypothetical protein [Variovorax sp. W1I1]
MELINATRMVTGYNMGLEPSGRELLVVVIKGTFRFPHPEEPEGHFALHETQLPLVMADTFSGAPGYSAPVYEVDFAPRKPRCDILLAGSAHAPQGRPTTRVEVGVRIGGWSKTMAVIGPRHWECGLSGASATPPGVFVRQPISYDVAFGGSDVRHEDPAQHAAYMPNPVGRGFHRHIKAGWVDGAPLPSTEEVDHAVREPGGSYRPMAFGPVGRGWEPRSRFAGTYDQVWRDEHFPFLPPDFDAQYFQAAPMDQQVPLDYFGAGPTEVLLANLTPEGLTRFTIPHLVAPVHVFPRTGEREDCAATLDTVVIEPDAQRFSLTWRVARPLRKSMFEISQVLVGKKGREWWQQRDSVPFPIPVVMVAA